MKIYKLEIIVQKNNSKHVKTEFYTNLADATKRRDEIAAVMISIEMPFLVSSQVEEIEVLAKAKEIDLSGNASQAATIEITAGTPSSNG